MYTIGLVSAIRMAEQIANENDAEVRRVFVDTRHQGRIRLLVLCVAPEDNFVAELPVGNIVHFVVPRFQPYPMS